MSIIKLNKHVSSFKVDPQILKAIMSFADWSSPRNQYYGLDASHSILLKYNLDLSEGLIHHFNQDTIAIYNLISPIIKHTQDQLQPSYCTKALITNLPAGKSIQEHIDPGWAFSIQHRFHWSLMTNEHAYLNVGDQKIHVQEGDIWEIDNKKPHSAINGGETDRVHLIFDLLIIDEVIGLTPSPFSPNSYDDKLFRNILHKKKKTGEFIVRKGN